MTNLVSSDLVGVFDFEMRQIGTRLKVPILHLPPQNIENFVKDVYKERNLVDMTEEKAKLFYSIAVSIFAIGGMLGGFSGGSIADKFGR